MAPAEGGAVDRRLPAEARPAELRRAQAVGGGEAGEEAAGRGCPRGKPGISGDAAADQEDARREEHGGGGGGEGLLPEEVVERGGEAGGGRAEDVGDRDTVRAPRCAASRAPEAVCSMRPGGPPPAGRSGQVPELERPAAAAEDAALAEIGRPDAGAEVDRRAPRARPPPRRRMPRRGAGAPRRAPAAPGRRGRRRGRRRGGRRRVRGCWPSSSTVSPSRSRKPGTVATMPSDLRSPPRGRGPRAAPAGSPVRMRPVG